MGISQLAAIKILRIVGSLFPARFENENLQTLAGQCMGDRQACRPTADNDHVMRLERSKLTDIG